MKINQLIIYSTNSEATMNSSLSALTPLPANEADEILGQLLKSGQLAIVRNPEGKQFLALAELQFICAHGHRHTKLMVGAEAARHYARTAIPEGKEVVESNRDLNCANHGEWRIVSHYTPIT
ncbi:MAG: hypothetical protein COY66_05875 [Candidatus Kerfeldbacteria bacterium CG_4_10_14_0_8_um_filter_42_10]|uniref:Uncharacterized protein n=1 Tax=Candidatus Kerfeldbacteria bacterium CG_4_10_14_0_8_um_filter_42_10 TaxID=2014248 RepID=A0A2M7RGC0_9BACT|nr:MAG: hypothetical protein COY66_05875 [Candidatus Kerfeldbacteria bacterium CG_4_10_14_0_8_um_filter_42_10]